MIHVVIPGNMCDLFIHIKKAPVLHMRHCM